MKIEICFQSDLKWDKTVLSFVHLKEVCLRFRLYLGRGERSKFRQSLERCHDFKFRQFKD